MMFNDSEMEAEPEMMPMMSADKTMMSAMDIMTGKYGMGTGDSA